jgi:lipid-binding SYLF domain-containing protein
MRLHCLPISSSKEGANVGYRNCRLAALAIGASALLGGCAHTLATRGGMTDAARQAQDEINGSAVAVNRMRAEPKMAALLRSAKGVLVVPDYGRGAYFIGGQGGRGVLLLRESGARWSEPAFYSLGGASVGLQAGGEAGPVALILMTGNAVDRFRDNTSTWQLGANTGLTVANFSGAQTVESINPKADIVRWSGAKGLYGGISAGATYITPDATLDDAYYHRMLTTQQILSDEVHTRRTASLREALAGASGASYR